MKSIRVIKTGHSSIQDFGRLNYLHYGVPISGAMDKEAMMIANILVNNPIEYPVIESTLMGGKFQFNDAMEISITGGDLSPKINGDPVNMWETVKVKPADILEFGRLKSGLRSYIGFNGLLDIKRVLGSYSYYKRSDIGISLSDNILLKIQCDSPMVPRRLKKAYWPNYNTRLTCRVMIGEQYMNFYNESINRFFQSEYTVQNDSDRMGYRLKGAEIIHKSSADIRSEGLGPGAIQVPGNSQPIIMMADSQSTGGYAKLGYVVQEDLWKLAQRKPGEKIRFKRVSLKAARKAYKNRLNLYKHPKNLYETLVRKKMKVMVNDVDYFVDIEYYE